MHHNMVVGEGECLSLAVNRYTILKAQVGKPDLEYFLRKSGRPDLRWRIPGSALQSRGWRKRHGRFHLYGLRHAISPR